MSRRAWIPLALVAAIVALVAVNFAMREDPEPDLGAPLPPPDAWRDDDEERAERQDGAEAEPAEDGVEPEAEDDGSVVEEAEVVGCDHPLIAAERGHWRRYRWRQSDEDRVAEMRLVPGRTLQLESGEREIGWMVRVTATDDESQLGEARLVTRCVPGQDAQEPWFGILERSLGLVLTDGGWRWPAALRAGQRFEGTARFDPRDSEMRAPDGVAGPQMLRVTRRHVVEGRETVEVPAGTYRAWKVVYEERQEFGPRGELGSGTLWVAPGIGLVKSRAENSQGIVQTIELTGVGGR